MGRSTEKHSSRYVDFVGDGNCSSHRDGVKSKRYGDEVALRRVECVGHIQKRMGRRPRRKKKAHVVFADIYYKINIAYSLKLLTTGKYRNRFENNAFQNDFSEFDHN